MVNAKALGSQRSQWKNDVCSLRGFANFALFVFQRQRVVQREHVAFGVAIHRTAGHNEGPASKFPPRSRQPRMRMVLVLCALRRRLAVCLLVGLLAGSGAAAAEDS